MSIRLSYRLQTMYSLLSASDQRKADLLIERYHNSLRVLRVVATQLERVINKKVDEAICSSVTELAILQI